jgi:hypothetical protein
MSTLNDLGNQNLKELSRVFSLEVNSPYIGSTSVVLKREKILLLNNTIISKSQIEPLICNYNSCAKNVITVFDPITNQNTSISIVALISALQQIGQ